MEGWRDDAADTRPSTIYCTYLRDREVHAVVSSNHFLVDPLPLVSW